MITAVIETPKGSTQKYAFNEEKNFFELMKVMPSGMVFPYDFGFIPNTKGADGDPLDVIVISEFGSFPGCRIGCRLIGVIKASQTGRDKKTVRNDRYLAIPDAALMFSKIKTYRDLPAGIIDELQYFFVNYNRLSGKKFEPLDVAGPDDAYRSIQQQCG